MKNYFLNILLICLITTNIKSQSISCSTPSTTIINNSIVNACNSCNELDDHLPLNSDSIIYIRLNFHYLTINNQTPGSYKNATIFEAGATVWGINMIFDSLYTAQLRFYPSPLYIKRPKIQFVLNTYSKTVDSLAYFSTGVGNWTALSAYTGDPNAIDIIYKGDALGGGYGEANGIIGKAIKFNGNANPLDTSYIWWNYPNILAHELGHCFGLTHTNFYSDACVQDFYLEGPGVWNNSAPPCDPSLDSTSSNNILGYHWVCQKYLSPRQIARSFYNFRNSSLLFNTLTPASQNYLRNAHSNADVNITTNQTWSINRFMKGSIIVKSGRTLTVKCVVSMLQNSKVLIEKGGKLIIDGGEFTNTYGRLWNGIEVSGSNTQAQNFFSGYAVNQGYLIIKNGGTIRNADVAVSTGTTDSNSNFDWSSTGGVISANSANFINNRKDVSLHSTTSCFLIGRSV